MIWHLNSKSKWNWTEKVYGTPLLKVKVLGKSQQEYVLWINEESSDKFIWNYKFNSMRETLIFFNLPVIGIYWTN